jgi:hypothetical protein
MRGIRNYMLKVHAQQYLVAQFAYAEKKEAHSKTYS